MDGVVFLTVYPLTLVPWTPEQSVHSLLVAILAAAVVARHAALAVAWSSVRRAA